MRILNKCWPLREGHLFWAAALLHVAPIWAYRYIPTQDGPSHLDNAQILRELGKSAAGYEARYEVRAEPIPNWTSHLLLAGMYYWVPPLTAEKLLVTLYILGFAGSFRYFLGAFGERCRPMSWLGLLFLFNRCFWLGFYNYCLSLIFVWLIVGLCLRRGGRLGWPDAVILMVLFPLAYFTHLAGLILALLGALAAALLVKPRSLGAPLLVGLAAAPSCLLALEYFEQTAFFEQGAARRLLKQPQALLQGKQVERELGTIAPQLLALDRELFEHHAGPGAHVSIFFLVVFGALVAAGCAEYCIRPAEPDAASPAGPGILCPLLLGTVFLALYLVLADNLGTRGGPAHGGYLKPRLALLPPLVLLACLRESTHAWVRGALRALAVTLLALNLVLVLRTFATDNDTLERLTAGIAAVGRGQRLTTLGIPRGSRPANPLAGARHYYCLGTDNLSVFNYEAGTPHFPIKFRSGVSQGQAADADILICWRTAPDPDEKADVLLFESTDLRIYRRRRGPS